MSLQEYDDNCPGCRPAIVDLKTKEVLSDDHPLMVKMLGIWANTSLRERRAYHRVMCLNSRDTTDLFLVHKVIDRLENDRKNFEN
jgi:hypothetical protein